MLLPPDNIIYFLKYKHGNGWDDWVDEEGISLNELTTDKPITTEKEDGKEQIPEKKPELSEEEKSLDGAFA